MTVKSSFMQAWVKTLGKFTVPCGAPYQLRNDEQMDSWMFTLEMVSWVTYHHVFEGRRRLRTKAECILDERGGA
jgi:hypothetical protein